MASDLHTDLVLHQFGNLVRIQPLKGGQPDGAALAIELKSCTVGFMESSVPLSKEKGSQKIFGIIGLQQLAGGSAIAIITGAKQVLTVGETGYIQADASYLLEGFAELAPVSTHSHDER